MCLDIDMNTDDSSARVLSNSIAHTQIVLLFLLFFSFV